MISLFHKQQIILQYFRHGKSQREIQRMTGIHRKTIRKYLREHEELLRGTGVVSILPPQYNSSGRKPRKLTKEVQKEILKSIEPVPRKNETQARQIMSARDIHKQLRGQGYDIGYSTVCNFIRQHRHPHS